MRNAMQMWKVAQPLLKMPTSNYFNLEVLRDKVVFIMGATGTGKSRLSINLAARFGGEIINSDKIQVYRGLDIVTNKVTKEEQSGLPHHLLGMANPYVDFTPKDFCIRATQVVESIHHKGKLPIIVGGSNSYIEALVSDPKYGFGPRYDCLFLWVDVALPLLQTSVSDRVDRMAESGFVDEVREVFDPNNRDYNKGILQAIGVPELDPYFRTEPVLGRAGRARELKRAIETIKDNTCKLACRQLEKIQRLQADKGWHLHRVDATQVFRIQTNDQTEEVWMRHVAKPASKTVKNFLKPHHHRFGSGLPGAELVTRSLNYSMFRNNNQPWLLHLFN